jgi:hypothetical protein
MCAMEIAKSQTYVVNETDKWLKFRDVVAWHFAVRRVQGLSNAGEVCSPFGHDSLYIGIQF